MLPDEYTIRASDTKEGKARLAAYYAALGRFVDNFARLETAVTLSLWHYAKATPEIAKVIFSNAKVDVGTRYINQLAEATGIQQAERDDLATVIQQVAIINTARNQILHFGAASVAEGNAIVSNALKAKGEPIVFPISPTVLGHMTADVMKIIIHLNHWRLGPTNVPPVQQELTKAVLRAPWRYKHPTQPRAQSKTA